MRTAFIIIPVIFLLAACGSQNGKEEVSVESIRETESFTHLQEAVKAGDYVKVKELIATNVDEKNLNEVLVDAAGGGQLAIVKLLLAEGANVDGNPNSYDTPLNRAVPKNEIEIVELLISKGADVSRQCGAEGMPLHTAAQYGRKDIAEILIANGADVDALASGVPKPLFLAIRSRCVGCGEVVRLLVDKGASLSPDPRFGQTPLHWAASENAHVRYLIDNGADIHAQDRQGRTPLHLAARNDHMHAVKELISCGADINIEDNYGKSPLDLAESERIKELLQNYGAVPERESSK